MLTLKHRPMPSPRCHYYNQHLRLRRRLLDLCRLPAAAHPPFDPTDAAHVCLALSSSYRAYGCWRAGASIPPNANDANSPPLPFPPPSPFPTSPLPSPSLPLSLPHYPFSPFSPPSFPSGPLKSARDLGERFSSPSGVRGGAPTVNAFWRYLEAKKRI